ncbi:L-2-amino-thiazoline-4-carboxylic acid hydrolase [Vallitalea okinawensis]|uniref:L-2-amino-thiazoline-4-carboxylic acid hydrolase n=1 Tax=Vallitalea okinawensis TaxID=2078660 RepID=UPI000CFC00C0|nr:L-2-amino-thiazoline-4-carboxylic acid hydrolase [Vallitalea okinawensis]
MRVDELSNYGKDIITIQKDARLPLKSKVKIIRSLLGFGGRLLWHMNPIGFFKFIKIVKIEKQKALQMDWTHVRARGISEENLTSVISKQVVAKVMVDILGYEQAAKIRNRFSDKCSYYIFQEVFAKPEDFVECGNGDFLVAFKEYYVALQDAMKKVGLEEYEIGIDTKDCFQMNITYCVYHEVAKALGNSMNCYYSTCYGDEVFFPKLCEQVNFEFKREGTLATGKHCCDMTFIRKLN